MKFSSSQGDTWFAPADIPIPNAGNCAQFPPPVLTRSVIPRKGGDSIPFPNFALVASQWQNYGAREWGKSARANRIVVLEICLMGDWPQFYFQDSFFCDCFL
jgi:hypothetical protein